MKNWQSRSLFLVVCVALLGGSFVWAGDSQPEPIARPKGYFQCYVPECEPLQVFMDIQERTVIDIVVMLTARERDSGKEQSKVKEFTIEPGKPWAFTPHSANDLDRIRWYIKETGEEWRNTPTMECRCSYFGSSIEVFVDGKKVDEYPNPNMPD